MLKGPFLVVAARGFLDRVASKPVLEALLDDSISTTLCLPLFLVD
jgi:hypothetical protein